jgi:hypothetical protein
MSIKHNYTSEDLHDHLMHGIGKAREKHKYISREWKKGRWQYTYADEKADKAAEQKKIEDTKRRAQREADMRESGRRPGGSATNAPKVSKEYLEEVAYNSQKNSFPIKTNTTDTKKNIESGKSTADKVLKPSSEYEAEAAYNSQKNEYPSNNKTASENNKDKKQSWIDKVKDKLGVDERQAYLIAKGKYDTASERKSEAEREADAAIENYSNARGVDDVKEASEWLHEAVSSHTYWKERVHERGKEYMSAKSEYMKTPMGKFLKAGEAIGDVAFDVSYTVEKAADKAKNAVEDAAWETGYAIRSGVKWLKGLFDNKKRN